MFFMLQRGTQVIMTFSVHVHAKKYLINKKKELKDQSL